MPPKQLRNHVEEGPVWVRDHKVLGHEVHVVGWSCGAFFVLVSIEGKFATITKRRNKRYRRVIEIDKLYYTHKSASRVLKNKPPRIYP